MRKFSLIAAAVLVTAGSILFATARGTAAPKPGLDVALKRTAHVSSVRYAFRVHIHEYGVPLTLHVRGQSDAHTISVHLATAGMAAAELLDGPFLYEQAPDGMAVYGKWRWLRVNIAHLPATSEAIQVVHALTPEPLLRVIARSHMHGNGAAYTGAVPYDDPVVREALTRLTGGIEFRGLEVTVDVGRDGLIHRVRLTGKTVDRTSTFLLVARLYAFGRPVHVSPPKPGTFIDKQLIQLSE
jgi:hypothetical protein